MKKRGMVALTVWGYRRDDIGIQCEDCMGTKENRLKYYSLF